VSDKLEIHFPAETLAKFSEWAIVGLRTGIDITNPAGICEMAGYLREHDPYVEHMDEEALRVLIALMAVYGEELVERENAGGQLPPRDHPVLDPKARRITTRRPIEFDTPSPN